MSQPIRLRLAHLMRSYGVILVWDALAWGISILAALILRFDFHLSRIHWGWTLSLIAASVLLQLVFGWVLWLYRNRYEIGSFDEVRALILSTLGVTAIGWVIAYVMGYGHGIPRSTMFIAAPIALLIMGVVRYVRRLSSERAMKPQAVSQRALLYGAGYLGQQTVKRLLTDAVSPTLPVGFLDEDPNKQHFEVRGVRVLGGLADLIEAARSTRATSLIVCVGDADAALMRRIDAAANAADLEVLVLPPLDQLLTHAGSLSDVRQLSIEDLIGRHPVRLETESIAQYLQDQVVLVTGAGGSIGSELSRTERYR